MASRLQTILKTIQLSNLLLREIVLDTDLPEKGSPKGKLGTFLDVTEAIDFAIGIGNGLADNTTSGSKTPKSQKLKPKPKVVKRR